MYSLSKKDLRGIVRLEAKRLETRLADRKITMELTESALDYLADVGFDPVYGARPLKRTIQRELETSIAQAILRGKIQDGETIVVLGGADGIQITSLGSLGATDEEEDVVEPEVDDASSSSSSTPSYSGSFAKNLLE